jgi:hypothetical protein
MEAWFMWVFPMVEIWGHDAQIAAFRTARLHLSSFRQVFETIRALAIP